jgi:AcrR family transcriptional regulator
VTPRTTATSRADAQHETRRQLLRAAGRRFLRDGYVATSLVAIAEEAGVTKGAVYSNFESKEDLFLALLREPLTSTEVYAPSLAGAVEAAEAAGGPDGGPIDAASFGRYADSVRPSRRHVALFLETNAAALRSDRVRAFVAQNTREFALELGEGLRDVFDAPHADPLALGLVAQSLYAGLLMHGAFIDEIDADLFALAYDLLAAATHPEIATVRRAERDESSQFRDGRSGTDGQPRLAMYLA